MVRRLLPRYQLWVCLLPPFVLHGVATGLGQSDVPAMAFSWGLARRRV